MNETTARRATALALAFAIGVLSATVVLLAQPSVAAENVPGSVRQAVAADPRPELLDLDSERHGLLPDSLYQPFVR